MGEWEQKGGDGSNGGSTEWLKEELHRLSALHAKEKGTNTTLLAQLRALKGNIEVICRIRPVTTAEKTSGAAIALEALGDGEVGVKNTKG
ncbi:unnamed protein product, partial [Discosporangium mesarthrocarpum]